MGTEESEPTPQAIVEPISGVLYPGMGDSYGRFFEIKGAPIYVTVNWDPPYPIYVAIVSETGYVRGGEVYGGSWSGVINAPDTGKNYFAISHNNYGVVITYSGEVIWP
ncbi:MAG: hypothetical protein QW482_05205 [Thermoproteota archaeon]